MHPLRPNPAAASKNSQCPKLGPSTLQIPCYSKPRERTGLQKPWPPILIMATSWRTDKEETPLLWCYSLQQGRSAPPPWAVHPFLPKPAAPSEADPEDTEDDHQLQNRGRSPYSPHPSRFEVAREMAAGKPIAPTYNNLMLEVSLYFISSYCVSCSLVPFSRPRNEHPNSNLSLLIRNLTVDVKCSLTLLFCRCGEGK